MFSVIFKRTKETEGYGTEINALNTICDLNMILKLVLSPFTLFFCLFGSFLYLKCEFKHCWLNLELETLCTVKQKPVRSAGFWSDKQEQFWQYPPCSGHLCREIKMLPNRSDGEAAAVSSKVSTSSLIILEKAEGDVTFVTSFDWTGFVSHVH